MAASWGKRNVTAWRPSVCQSVCLSHLSCNLNRTRGAYSTWFTRGQHATRPAYISARQWAGPTYLLLLVITWLTEWFIDWLLSSSTRWYARHTDVKSLFIAVSLSVALNLCSVVPTVTFSKTVTCQSHQHVTKSTALKRSTIYTFICLSVSYHLRSVPC